MYTKAIARIRRALVIVPLVLFMTGAGCAKRVPNLTPAQNIQLSADQALDILANSANGAEKSGYALEASHVISTSLARSIGNYSKEAAQVAQKALAINKSGQTPQQKAVAVIALLQTIKQLPADVHGFVNSPTADATVQALVTLVQTIVNTAKGLLASQGGQ